MKKLEILILLVFFNTICVYPQIIKRHVPDKLVVLTFDDATASHYSVVAPLLKQYGFGATFFICEFPPNFADSSKYMNWRQIKALDQMGFEIANHSHTHPPLSPLSKDKLISQIEYIEHKCDSLGIAKPTTFAYPGYDCSLPVIEFLKGKDYQFARVGGARAYDPLTDYPLLVPSYSITASSKTQIYDAFQKANSGKIVVLTIHGVPDVEHPAVSTSLELFKEYLQYLADNHFKVIPLRDLKKYVNIKNAQKSIVPDLNKKLKN